VQAAARGRAPCSILGSFVGDNHSPSLAGPGRQTVGSIFDILTQRFDLKFLFSYQKEW
jgi:hypothetical protein